MVAQFAIDPAFWAGRSVFLTGHTGFKGSWLTQWLADLGAKVTGYSLAPETTPNLFTLAKLETLCQHRIGDIRDYDALKNAIAAAQPEIVIHMAAQPLVRRSYRAPLETFATNVQGTAHLLEACRNQRGVKAVLVISSDKCYENREWSYGYRETDSLGGHDPYSASKACTEIVTGAYRSSYPDAPPLASARAGNVFGGGDWSEDRLIPDAMRAFAAGETLIIRSPRAERPWQHVSEPLAAYLMLARALVEGGRDYARPWNIGPAPEQIAPVERIVSILAKNWDGARWEARPDPAALHEAGLLHLDSTQAMRVLGWQSSGKLEPALAATIAWRYATSADDVIARMRADRVSFGGQNIAAHP